MGMDSRAVKRSPFVLHQAMSLSIGAIQFATSFPEAGKAAGGNSAATVSGNGSACSRFAIASIDRGSPLLHSRQAPLLCPSMPMLLRPTTCRGGEMRRCRAVAEGYVTALNYLLQRVQVPTPDGKRR